MKNSGFLFYTRVLLSHYVNVRFVNFSNSISVTLAQPYWKLN